MFCNQSFPGEALWEKYFGCTLFDWFRVTLFKLYSTGMQFIYLCDMISIFLFFKVSGQRYHLDVWKPSNTSFRVLGPDREAISWPGLELGQSATDRERNRLHVAHLHPARLGRWWLWAAFQCQLAEGEQFIGGDNVVVALKVPEHLQPKLGLC